MRLKTIIVMIISLIILNHCKKTVNPQHQFLPKEITINENKSANVRFSLNASVESEFIAYPRLAVSPWQNKIILYGLYSGKSEKPKLMAITYDKSLKFLQEKTFFFGQGPGDVGNNNIISIGKDRLFISENSNFRVSIYKNDWTYQKSVRHKLEIDAFEIYEDGKIFISKEYTDLNSDKQTVSFMIGSTNGYNTKRIFTTAPFIRTINIGNAKKRIIGGDSTHSWFYINKELFILICGKYRILKFDAAGNILKDIMVKVERHKTDHSRDDEFLKDQGFFKLKSRIGFSDSVDPTAAMIPLTKGFVVIRRNDFSSNCNEFADGDYYSYQLEYLGKIKVPCFYDLFTLFTGLRKNESAKFDNGYLYLIQDRNEHIIIEKWEVKE